MGAEASAALHHAHTATDAAGRALAQLLRRPVDHRSDLFALGLVFLELLTGQHLFWLSGVDLRELGMVTYFENFCKCRFAFRLGANSA